MEAVRVDQRREAGLRTRARLLDAALGLLAERGEGGVTLREVTDAAEANVAAVSYHFGSLRALREAAIEQALERYLDDKQQALGTLAPSPTLEQLAAAFARPMIDALSSAPLSAELRNKTEKQLQRLLVAIIAGALRGTSTA